MAQEEAYEKISATAKLVAHVRTFTDIPFAREIATASGAKKYFQTLASKSVETLIQLTPLWEARYKATDQIIAQHHITQVLEIAAGLSPRGLVMTADPDVVYVATDLPQVLEQEKAIAESILATLNMHRPNLYFRIANALDREGLLQAATPFQSGRPIAVITEGLLVYLTIAEKETLAGNVQDLLRQYGGIWITPDVGTTKQSWKDSYDNNIAQRAHNISSPIKRKIEKNTFEDENEMRQFFTRAGFTIEEYPHTNVQEHLSSIDRLNLNREEILELLQLGKTLILTVCSG